MPNKQIDKKRLQAETFNCECIKCGFKLTTEKHCVDIKCSKCGGKMRRVERPGPGRASEMPMVFPVSVDNLVFTEGENTTNEIQVLQVGIWKHPMYGKIKITEKDITEFIENFDNKVRKDLAITEGHPVGNQELPAIGWFTQLVNKGRDGLWAVIEWTKEGKRLLEEKAYKYFSPEFYESYEDPEDHKIYSNVLVGGALTNRPYFKGLQTVMLSEKTLVTFMELKDILEKKPEDLTDEEKDFVKEKKEELTDEQKEAFKDVVEEGTEEGDKPEGDKPEGDKPEGDKPEGDKPEGDKVEGSEKGVIVSKDVLDTLQRNAQEGVKAMAEMRRQLAETYISSLIFSESNKIGPLLPKSKDKAVKFLLTLTEEQQESFKEFMAEMPKGKMFSELGKDVGTAIKASEQVQSLVEDKMSKNKDFEYRQALEQVFAENPALAEASRNE